MTLAEMASQASATDLGGVKCPKCHCRHLDAYRTERGVTTTFRYRRCRHCGHKVYTGEKVLRDVNGNGESE